VDPDPDSFELLDPDPDPGRQKWPPKIGNVFIKNFFLFSKTF
jgi:hypothetical protein